MIGKQVAAFVCFFVVLSWSALYAQKNVKQSFDSQIDTEVLQFMKDWNLQGGSLALIKNGRLVYRQAYGTADVAIPMQPDHLFRIASLSKPITAIAVLKLVESKQIGLEDKVFGDTGILNDETYLRINDRRIKDITVKNLLQHTAGWDRNKSAEGDPMFEEDRIAKSMGKPADSNTIIEYMLTKKLDFDPGEKFAYSNFGYNVLGRIIEKVSGLTYAEYVQKNILDPLEITDMVLAKNQFCDKRPREVVYHVNQKEPFAQNPEHFPYGAFNIEAMDSHGGWLASTTDLAKILVASAGWGTQRDLISPQTYEAMVAPGATNKNYGLGWCVNPEGNRWHTGSLIGASAMMVQLKNGLGGVVLFNGNPLTGEYFQSLDKMMWMAMREVKDLPSPDLFLESAAPEEPLKTELKIASDLL